MEKWGWVLCIPAGLVAFYIANLATGGPSTLAGSTGVAVAVGWGTFAVGLAINLAWASARNRKQ
jgi:hypothetical protein